MASLRREVGRERYMDLGMGNSYAGLLVIVIKDYTAGGWVEIVLCRLFGL